MSIHRQPRRKKLHIYGATLLLLVSSPALGAQARQEATPSSSIPVTIYADDSYPPYSYLDGDTVKGIYTDILKIAFSRMKGYVISIEANPWKRILLKIESGEYFAFYPPYYYPEQRPYINPYSVAILEEAINPICRKEIMTKVSRTRWPDDFYGLTFSYNDGFQLGGQHFIDAVNQGRIKLSKAHSTEQNILKMAGGRTDCYINGQISILQTLHSLRKRNLIGPLEDFVMGPAARRELGHVGYARNGGRFPFKDHFVKTLDEILVKMKESGEIDAIVKAYVE